MVVVEKSDEARAPFKGSSERELVACGADSGLASDISWQPRCESALFPPPCEVHLLHLTVTQPGLFEQQLILLIMTSC